MNNIVSFAELKHTRTHKTFGVTVESIRREAHDSSLAKVKVPIDDMGDPHWYKARCTQNHTGFEDKTIIDAVEKVYDTNLI